MHPSDDDGFVHRLDRRTFLRTAGCTSGAAVLGACAAASGAGSSAVRQDARATGSRPFIASTRPLTGSRPRVRCCHLPTPLEELPRLSAAFGGPRMLVKRDDQTGLATGGNKARKLEFLVAAAQAEGADTLVTTGSLQSNHCRQTAAAAARYGLHCVLLLRGEPSAGTPEGNLLLDQLLGAEVRIGTQSLEDAAASLRAAGRTPYVIPGGGSNAVGATGYVAAVEELVAQLDGHRERVERVDWIVFPTGSGGTQAGIAVGARALGLDAKVLGIAVSRRADEQRVKLAPIANATAAHLGLRERFGPDDFLVDSDFVGGGYGVMGDLEREAIHTAARTEGLLLDPVYTGRAFGGLLRLVDEGAIRRDETVLFWHTGGTPGLFVSKYASALV